MLVFASGRVVITGGKCLRSINVAWDALKQKLMRFIIPVLTETAMHKKKRGSFA
jgi:TATA-box binding protein (TBP) (component of TFIID and TFIIIB)